MPTADALQAWAEGRITEARVGPASTETWVRVSVSVADLVGVLLFLREKSTQLFGMRTARAAFARPEELGERSTEALVDWYRWLEAHEHPNAQDELVGRGISMQRYEGFEQDDRGIARGMGPAIAWFTDPAGNILAVLQQP